MGPLQLSFPPRVKPLVTPLIRVRDWWKKLKNHESNLFSSWYERKCEKKQQLSQHQICRQNIRHQKFIREHHIWCHVKISEVATLVSMIPKFWCCLEVIATELHLCFVIKGKVWWKPTFLPMRWLLSLCYIINTWSYSSHLHHMLLRGMWEKVLISRFVERKSRKRDCNV